MGQKERPTGVHPSRLRRWESEPPQQGPTEAAGASIRGQGQREHTRRQPSEAAWRPQTKGRRADDATRWPEAAAQ